MDRPEGIAVVLVHRRIAGTLRRRQAVDTRVLRQVADIPRRLRAADIRVDLIAAEWAVAAGIPLLVPAAAAVVVAADILPEADTLPAAAHTTEDEMGKYFSPGRR